MSSVNKVILVGHLGRDPDQRSFQNGGGCVNVSIATGESWKDRATGERKQRTEWHNIVIMNEGLQKVAMQYLKKGSQVYIEGQLRTRKWQDQQGNDKWSTEIVIGAFNGGLTLLDKREGDAGRRDYSSHADTPGGGWSSGGRSTGAGDDLDDDVPF